MSNLISIVNVFLNDYHRCNAYSKSLPQASTKAFIGLQNDIIVAFIPYCSNPSHSSVHLSTKSHINGYIDLLAVYLGMDQI